MLARKGENDMPSGNCVFCDRVIGKPHADNCSYTNTTRHQKFDTGKRRYDLLPWDALAEVVKCLEFGAAKYSDNNWTRCESLTRYWVSSMRHTIAWFNGSDTDAESGLNPLAHAIAGLLFVLSLCIRGEAKDDRPDTTPPAP